MTTKGLQRILRKRLPDIDLWRNVTVYNWDSKGLRRFADEPVSGMFYIVWSDPYRRDKYQKNKHDKFFCKECKLIDIDEVADRNNMRLRNKTKAYK